MTPTQRAIWTDLLALAGRSRWPGVIAANIEDPIPCGYPASWLAATLNVPEADINGAVSRFEATGKVILEKDPNGGLIIRLRNWDKYQSEYQRQRKYRAKKQPELQGELQPELQGELQPELQGELQREGEGEGEGEKKEKEKKNLPPAVPQGGHNPRPAKKHRASINPNYTPEYQTFWAIYPRHAGKALAAEQWGKRLEEGLTADMLVGCATRYAEAVKIRMTDEGYIMQPATFLGPNRRWEDYTEENYSRPEAPEPQWAKEKRAENERISKVFAEAEVEVRARLEREKHGKP